MKHCLPLLALTIAAILSSVAPVNADVFIKLEQSGFAPEEVSGPIFAAFANSYGTYDITLAFGSQLTQPLTSLATVLSTTDEPNTLTISVSAIGATGPSSLADFISSFTKITVSAGWTVAIDTYLDPSDTKYGTAIHLGTVNFSNASAADDIDHVLLLPAAPYSITAIYQLTSVGLGEATTSATVNVTVIREPASLALLGAALVGLGVFARRWRIAI